MKRRRGVMLYIVRALVLALFLFLIQGNPVYAHERWFVDQDGQHIGESHWLDWLNLVIIFGGLILIVLVILAGRSTWYHKLEERFEKLQQTLPKGVEWRFVAFLAGVMLIANAVTGAFLAPDLILPGRTVSVYSSVQVARSFLSGDSPLYWNASTFGGIAQLLLGVILLSQTSFLIPGVLILVLALPMAVFYFVPDLLIDYVVELVALAFALIFFGMGASSIDRRIAVRLKLDPSRYAKLPVPIIRIGVGLTLVILALHDKLLAPNMALTFLDTHYLNFMELMGFTGFTNIRFVFAAGIVELGVGILLILGIATRFVAAIVFVIMGITMIVLGIVELFGHLPIMGIALLLLYRGSGGFRLAPQMRAGG
ncbi:MAG: DoxX family membrane protein [Dehalococcoidales bacterium]|nr:DoxX family membrane protein [Dehalococcoidales bacterium]